MQGWIRALAVLLPLAAAACRTPEVAEDYAAETLLPDEVANALADEDPTRRSEAAEQVGAMDPGSRRRALLALSRDERAHVRLLAVGLIARHHVADADAASRLAELLSSDPDPDVRTSCVDALSRGDRRRALDALLVALEGDSHLGVRAEAAAALDRLTGQDFGRAVLREAEEAEAAADDAAIAYEEWLAENAAKEGS